MSDLLTVDELIQFIKQRSQSTVEADDMDWLLNLFRRF